MTQPIAPINIQEWSMARETSIEIARAIAWLANDEPEMAQRIWEEPTAEEFTQIWQRVTLSGELDAESFYWQDQTLGAIRDQIKEDLP